jgi:hypothetical protein
MSLCLSNLISTQGECDVTGSSLSVTDLPFMSIKTGSKIIEEFDCTVDEMVTKLISQAVTYVKNDFKTRSKTLFKTGKIIRREDVTRFNECTDLVAADGLFKGYLITNTSLSRSNILVERISAYIDGDVTLKVYNAIDGTELDSKTITAITGINNYEINGSYAAEEILIGFIQSVGVHPPSNETEFCFCNKYTTLKPITIDDADYRECNTVNGKEMFGISYSIQCDIDSYMCEIREGFSFPILYKFGMLLHQKAQMSERLNETILKFAKEDVYEYYEYEYNNNINSLIEGFNPPCDDCFEPNSMVSVVSTAP